MVTTTERWVANKLRDMELKINPPLFLKPGSVQAEDRVLGTLDKAIAEMNASRIFYDNPHFQIGLASRYWPATTEVHQHMSDLTLSPAPKGGYTVASYEDNILFAGTLDACTTFMAEQMEELEDRKATAEIEAEAKRKRYEADKLVATEASRIRDEAEKRIAALHIVT